MSSSLRKRKPCLGDELRTGKLDVFYDLYNLAQKRRFERYQYALKVLERPMDFTGNDTFNLDRSKAPWPKDEAELNALWDGKVKFDELSLKTHRQERQRNSRNADASLQIRYSSPGADQQ
ncbi:Tail-specific protease precursor [Salmonella enterica subsp. enterica serovar Typhimurium]|nr:Tail-specific protease precursor [Salmonella enterica subsp. enterica serovar Typhimurium]